MNTRINSIEDFEAALATIAADKSWQTPDPRAEFAPVPTIDLDRFEIESMNGEDTPQEVRAQGYIGRVKTTLPDGRKFKSDFCVPENRATTLTLRDSIHLAAYMLILAIIDTP